MKKPVDPQKFLARLDPSDKREYARQWSRFNLKGELETATDEMIEGAFAAWKHWGKITSTETDSEINHGCLSVNRVIQQAMQERPDQAEALATRVVEMFSCGNVDVLATLAILFLDRPEQFPIAEPGLVSLASRASPHPIPPPDSGNRTLRALAFQVLHEHNSKHIGDPELSAARKEYAHSLSFWAKTRPEPERQRLLDQAEILMGLS